MKKFFLMLALLTLTACENAPPEYTPPPLTFETQSTAPFNVNVARVEVLNHYQSSYAAPNVEHEFAITPVQSVTLWVDKRLRAAGNTGRLEVSITEASVRETPLKKTPGVKGLFTDDQDTRYDAKLIVTFRLYTDDSTVSRAVGDVEVTRYATINERATIYDRQKLYHLMLDRLMLDFQREANNRLRQHFSPYLR